MVHKFDDFSLHLEFRVPKGANSGVYLRARYELQIDDAAGLEPSSHHSPAALATFSLGAMKP